MMADDDPESRRVQAVDDLNLMGTPAEERFDRITRLARSALGVPVALIDLVHASRVWAKSASGVDFLEGPRSHSYCQYAVEDRAAFIVEDSMLEPRLVGNPYREHVRFYAGVPVMHDGQPVGTLCVWDTKPRLLSAEGREALSDLAALAERELRLARLSESQLRMAKLNEELERKALVDPLTRGWNRGAIFEICARELEGARSSSGPVSIALLDIDHFKVINDTHGHPAGDEVLRVTAERIRAVIRPTDAVGRYGGEEFLIVFPNAAAEAGISAADRVRVAVGKPVQWRSERIPVTASVGVTVSKDGSHFVELLARAADEALYRAKRNGRDRVESRWVSPSFMRLPSGEDS